MKKLLATILAILSIACIFCGCGSSEESDLSQTETDTYGESGSSENESQNTVSYNLPTIDELIDSFETNFTLSNIKKEASKAMFEVSTGETIFGFTNASDKVETFQVFVSGSSVDSLLDADYHFYPLCHFLTNIKGETVTVDDIVEILLSVEATTKSGSVSNSATWKVKKEGIQYELVLTEYSTYNYCTMDIYARIQ